MSKIGLLALLALVLTAGCTTTATFEGEYREDRNDVSQAERGIPRVSDITSHIQCEIYRELYSNQEFRNGNYVASVLMTLSVTDDGSINPSLAVLKPLAAPNKQLSVGSGFQSKGTAFRTFVNSFTLDLSRDPSSQPLVLAESVCQKGDSRLKNAATGLRGNLRIGNIISEGIRYKNENEVLYTFQKSDSTTTFKSPIPTFGSTIEFTVVRSAGINPIWTLEGFIGPGGSTQFLNYARTAKDTLVLTFAPSTHGKIIEGSAEFLALPELDQKKVRENRPTSEGTAAAAQAAQNATTNLLLLGLSQNR